MTGKSVISSILYAQSFLLNLSALVKQQSLEERPPPLFPALEILWV
jgi:hypothetical protein